MYFEWRPYVPVAQRRAKAARFAQQLAKKEGRQLEPISIAGRTIARTFWGQAWCENLEHYSDFANRLPRGRTYVRNGSVVDLVIKPGRIDAYVGGSDVYNVTIEIDRLKAKTWKKITADCAASIDSLLDLLGGRLSDGVMQRLTRPGEGLFPQPSEIDIRCSCPDWAVLCKHAAAVLYGVGARLDDQPELLFRLREVDHAELVSQAVSADNLDEALGSSGAALAGEDLGEMFGIELDSTAADAPPRKRVKKAKRKSPARKRADTAAPKRKSTKKKAAAGKTTARKRPAAKRSTRRKAAKKK